MRYCSTRRRPGGSMHANAQDEQSSQKPIVARSGLVGAGPRLEPLERSRRRACQLGPHGHCLGFSLRTVVVDVWLDLCAPRRRAIQWLLLMLSLRVLVRAAQCTVELAQRCDLMHCCTKRYAVQLSPIDPMSRLGGT